MASRLCGPDRDEDEDARTGGQRRHDSCDAKVAPMVCGHLGRNPLSGMFSQNAAEMGLWRMRQQHPFDSYTLRRLSSTAVIPAEHSVTCPDTTVQLARQTNCCPGVEVKAVPRYSLASRLAQPPKAPMAEVQKSGEHKENGHEAGEH